MRPTGLSLRQLFSTLFILFLGLLAATALQAWTGPTGTAPSANTSAPINIGTTDQVKNAGLSLNALTVFGSGYVQNNLGIAQASPVVALDVNGTLKIGNGGEVCQAISAGAIRYNTSNQKIEYCNGTSWGSVSTTIAANPGSQTFTGSGTFTVPSSFTYLTVIVRGASGGGGTGGTSRVCGAIPAGGAGGTSVFGGVSASGGGGGAACGGPTTGYDGSGSGGDTNFTGGGAKGGAGQNLSGGGLNGGNGGNGGLSIKTYTMSTLTPGSLVSVTVGGGGAGSSWTAGSGSAGTGGDVDIIWQ